MESSGEFQEMNVDAGLESWTNPSWTFSQPTAALNSNEIHTELFFRPHLSYHGRTRTCWFLNRWNRHGYCIIFGGNSHCSLFCIALSCAVFWLEWIFHPISMLTIPTSIPSLEQIQCCLMNTIFSQLLTGTRTPTSKRLTLFRWNRFWWKFALLSLLA